MTRIVGFFGVAIVAAASTTASAQILLYDTGVHETVLFNGSATNLGWTSGNAGATQPQRWTAQPFTLGAGDFTINEIEAEYFVPGADPTDIGWVIWERIGETAPTQANEVASGMVAYGGVAGAPFAIPGVSVPSGDYYLTVYGVGSTIGWFTAAPDGINFIDPTGNPWMWRSSEFPTPGMQVYQLDPSILSANLGDPDDIYNAAFRLRGVPAPSSLALLGLGGLVAMRRRRN